MGRRNADPPSYASEAPLAAPREWQLPPRLPVKTRDMLERVRQTAPKGR